MALLGNPTADIMALINSGISPQDPQQKAMMLAIQNAMGQRVRQTPIMSQIGAPATDSEIGDHAGEMISTMTPRDEQPNYNNHGFDPYVKFPEDDAPEEGIRGGIPAPYREDGGDLIPNKATSYNQQPGEDQAAAMVDKAVEGRGVTYPKANDADGDEVMYDEAYAAVEPEGVHGRGSHPDPDNWEDNRTAFIKKYGMSPEEFLDDSK